MCPTWPNGLSAGRSYSPRSAVHRLTGPCRGPKTMSGTTSSAEPHDMGFGSFIERLSMAFHRNPSKDKEFQTIRKAMVFPPNLSADAPAAPVPLPWSDALPPEPPAPPQTASGNVRVEELTIEDGPELERAVAATFAVDGVKDATRYGLTIPFLRWLIAYKAELTAEDFAVVSREDLDPGRTEADGCETTFVELRISSAAFPDRHRAGAEFESKDFRCHDSRFRGPNFHRHYSEWR